MTQQENLSIHPGLRGEATGKALTKVGDWQVLTDLSLPQRKRSSVFCYAELCVAQGPTIPEASGEGPSKQDSYLKMLARLQPCIHIDSYSSVIP